MSIKKRNHGQIVKFQYPTHVARGKYVCRDLLTKLGTSTEAEFLPSSCPDIESLVQLKDVLGFSIIRIQSLFLVCSFSWFYLSLKKYQWKIWWIIWFSFFWYPRKDNDFHWSHYSGFGFVHFYWLLSIHSLY